MTAFNVIDMTNLSTTNTDEIVTPETNEDITEPINESTDIAPTDITSVVPAVTINQSDDFSFFDGAVTKDEELARAAIVANDANSLFMNMITSSNTGQFNCDTKNIYWSAQPAIKNIFGISPTVSLSYCGKTPDKAIEKYTNDTNNPFRNTQPILFPISGLLYRIASIGGSTNVAPSTELNGILHPSCRLHKYPNVQDIRAFMLKHLQYVHLDKTDYSIAVSIGDGKFYQVTNEDTTPEQIDNNEQLNDILFEMYYKTIPSMDKNRWDLLANVSPYKCELQRINFPLNQVVMKIITNRTIDGVSDKYDLTGIMQFAYEDIPPLLTISIYNRT